jgi:hypothetical protein
MHGYAQNGTFAHASCAWLRVIAIITDRYPGVTLAQALEKLEELEAQMQREKSEVRHR